MVGKNKSGVSIISGADGPTSVFIAGRSGKKTFKESIRQYKYQIKRKIMEKKIFADAHTLEEVVVYAKETYHATEIAKTQNKYIMERRNLRESLIIRHKPDLLGELKEIVKTDVYNEDTIKELQRQIQHRSEMLLNIPDHEMPMDFHIYEIKIDDGCMEIEVDYTWKMLGMSYAGSKKVIRRLRKIEQDLYIYYGVTEEDIKNKSERYFSLLATLST